MVPELQFNKKASKAFHRYSLPPATRVLWLSQEGTPQELRLFQERSCKPQHLRFTSLLHPS